MASDESSELNLTPDLLNDFYAECDEHLGIVRQSLVLLEQDPQGSGSAALIQKLFRSFHSLKGIIGMVGIGAAEQLAHRTEDYLRELSKENTRLSEEGMDLLARAAQGIEQTVASFRDRKPLPDVGPVLAKFNTVIPPPVSNLVPEESKTQRLDQSVQTKIDEATAKGLGVWKCTFVPSTVLNERGINVNRIRESLSLLGEIIHSAPHISGGTMAFEFFLAAGAIPEDLEEWAKDGASFELLRRPSVAAAALPKHTAPAPDAPTSVFVAPSHFVRVELHRLDDLMRVAGELVIQRARLEEQITRIEANGLVDTRGLHEVNLGFGRQFRELRETVMRLRMVPIAEIFDRLPFVVRDLTRGTEKKVRLETRGQQTELDKYVVERLKDPMLHLVRNAISHGIEDPSARTAAGKPAEAKLTLSAITSGETVIVEIADDGRGIDRQKVIDRGQQMGVPIPEVVDEAAILDLICLPGFSTRDEADRAAGRGVGMSVVSSTLRELGGNLFLSSEAGRGTRFTMRLPLTLLITDALIVTTANQQFAIPQSSVEEVMHIQESEVKRIEHSELVSVRGAALPLVRLRSVFGFPESDRKMPSVLVFQSERGRVGLVVDRIMGQRQVVVRSLRDPLIHVPGVIGATELGDGKPLLIIDPLILSKQNAVNRSGATDARLPLRN